MSRSQAAALRPPPPRRASATELAWAIGCVALALLPSAGRIPVWVLALIALTAAGRLTLALRGGTPLPRSLRGVLTLTALVALFLQLRTFNGLTAGTSLLALAAGLKLLETETVRDVRVVTLIVSFLCLAALLAGDSFWLLGYLIGVCWIATATLLRLAPAPLVTARQDLRLAARLLLQALPIALLLWLFFPRLSAPLWHVPSETRGSASGLGDSMSPGDITDLALSEDVALRVRFDGPAPPPQDRYWRGPVLHDFDGRTWRRGAAPAAQRSAEPPLPLGTGYRYRASLEPSERRWVYALDTPVTWSLANTLLTEDGMLLRSGVIDRAVDLRATSYPRTRPRADLDARSRRRDTALPPGRNPRTLEFARTLRSAHPDDLDYASAVLDMIRREPFYYTLDPPPLGRDAVDEFLFDTRRGFCGHYASAFATMMRAVGIPARVVTGYQGGVRNPFSDYWILRQSDAHAWVEVWIAGRGWLRQDPTAAVAPQRIDQSGHPASDATSALDVRWNVSTPRFADWRLRFDALRELWHDRVLGFDAEAQEGLLDWLHVPGPSAERLAIALGASLALAGLALAWAGRRESAPATRDRLSRLYARLERRMSAAGQPRLPHEGAEAWAARVAAVRPDLAPQFGALCRLYSRLRYEASAPADALPKFAAALRRFRPRGSRASRESRSPASAPSSAPD